MATYRFHGSYAEIRVGVGLAEKSHTLTTYGQAVELDESMVKTVVDQGCRLLPEGEFLEVFPGPVNKQDTGFPEKQAQVEQLYQTWKLDLLTK